MYETGFFRSDMLCQMGKKCDHIMFRNGFDLIDTRDIKFNVFGTPNRICIGLRDHSNICHRLTGMGFDFIPDAKFAFG